jgi:hypothetical protein
VYGSRVKPISSDAPLAEIADAWRSAGKEAIRKMDLQAEQGGMSPQDTIPRLMVKAMLYNSEGMPALAGKALDEAREALVSQEDEAPRMLYTLIYYQGVTALRRGETENCIECRGRRVRASCRSLLPPGTSSRTVRGARSAISPSISACSPTTWKSAGCSIWPT